MQEVQLVLVVMHCEQGEVHIWHTKLLDTVAGYMPEGQLTTQLPLNKAYEVVQVKHWVELQVRHPAEQASQLLEVSW